MKKSNNVVVYLICLYFFVTHVIDKNIWAFGV